MNVRTLWLCLLLLGCPEEKKAEPMKAPAPDAAAAPEAKAPPPDAAVVTENVVPAPQPEPDAEVEFFGDVDPGKLKPARIVFLVTKGPCEATSEELEVIEQTDVSPGKLFTEMFFPQGTVAHLCAVALDAKGKQVGFAAYAKNPVTFQGQGEVEVKDVVLKLTSVKARAAPKGM
jgi:hypothetical protein